MTGIAILYEKKLVSRAAKFIFVLKLKHNLWSGRLLLGGAVKNEINKNEKKKNHLEYAYFEISLCSLQHMFWNLNEVDSYRISFVSLTKDISKEIVMLVDTVNES